VAGSSIRLGAAADRRGHFASREFGVREGAAPYANALIIGPGGYKVRDFIRIGLPMSVVFLVVMLAMVNVVF